MSTRNIKWIKLCILWLIISISSACALPILPNNNNSDEGLQATISALETQVNQPTATQNQSDVPHSPPATATLEAIPEATLPPSTPYKGYISWWNNKFVAYDFQGASLGFQVDSGASEWYSENEITILPDSIYYSTFGTTSGVFRVDTGGTTRLNYIDGQEPVSISVSSDGNLIAWSTNQWVDSAPSSAIYIANIDGSSTRLVEQILPEAQVDGWLIFHPLRWTSDGKLLYATGPTGIGGYLLFWGYNGLRLYDPVQNTTEMLVDDNEHLGLCLSSITDDLSKVAIVCGDQSRTVRVRTLATGQEIQFPVLPDQNNAGSAKFSPSGEWLAYVIQRMDPENEFGQVVVVPVDGSTAPRVIDQAVGGKFTVVGWATEDFFLASLSDFNGITSIWRMSRDGNNVTQLSSGNFVGFFPK